MSECTECDDPNCPGTIICPACGVEDHGIEAETHIIDHGICWACLKDWQMNLDEGLVDPLEDCETWEERSNE